MKKKKLWITLAIIAAAVAVLLYLGRYESGPWRGKVIDAETKQPIEGAAVVAVWQRELRGPAGTESRFLDAKETLTGKDGQFEIPAQSFLHIFFIREIHGPTFTIYKPGYGSFPRYQVSPKKDLMSVFDGEGAVVELPKLKTKEERIQKMPHSGTPFFDHDNKKRKFIQLLNVELRELGLTPYREEE